MTRPTIKISNIMKGVKDGPSQHSGSAMNVLDDVHKELVGGAKMGRQIVLRLSSEIK